MQIDIDILLTWGATYKKVDAEETIFREGNECHFYYQLVSGSIRWTNIDEDGKEFIQNMIVPGECFGEMPLFDNLPYAASAIANKDSVILRLHKPTFLQLLKEEPLINFSFSKMLSQRLRFKFLLMNEMACHNPEHIICALLSHLKHNKKNVCPVCHKIHLTRQQIANMTGLRVETVIRAIRELETKGKVTIEKGKVYC
jgi:CRP/FNR family transcriptional regulator, cyclic AMP receptor protein